MSSGGPNPYASPQTESTPLWEESYDAADVKKMQAIIKDAGQFWLAIAMCVLCGGTGAIVVGPWYLFRFMQWRSMAKAYPILLDRDALRGSVAQEFRSAKIQLIIGMTVGALILLLVLLCYVAMSM